MKKIFITYILCNLLALTAHSNNYSNFYIFGDSFSDVGNVNLTNNFSYENGANFNRQALLSINKKLNADGGLIEVEDNIWQKCQNNLWFLKWQIDNTNHPDSLLVTYPVKTCPADSDSDVKCPTSNVEEGDVTEDCFMDCNDVSSAYQVCKCKRCCNNLVSLGRENKMCQDYRVYFDRYTCYD